MVEAGQQGAQSATDAGLQQQKQLADFARSQPAAFADLVRNMTRANAQGRVKQANARYAAENSGTVGRSTIAWRAVGA
jgi:hypothetical protein